MRALAIPRVLSFLLPIPRCGTRFPDAQEQPGGPNSGAGIPGKAGWQERTRGVGSSFPGRRRLRRQLCF